MQSFHTSFLFDLYFVFYFKQRFHFKVTRWCTSEALDYLEVPLCWELSWLEGTDTCSGSRGFIVKDRGQNSKDERASWEQERSWSSNSVSFPLTQLSSPFSPLLSFSQLLLHPDGVACHMLAPSSLWLSSSSLQTHLKTGSLLQNPWRRI